MVNSQVVRYRPIKDLPNNWEFVFRFVPSRKEGLAAKATLGRD